MKMSPRHQTIAVLIGSWIVLEIPLLLNAFVGDSSVGVPITLGLVGVLFCFLAYKRKTWARHLVLLYLGYNVVTMGMGSMAHPSMAIYLLVATQCFFFWGLCWNRPVLGFLGVIPEKEIPEAARVSDQSPSND